MAVRKKTTTSAKKPEITAERRAEIMELLIKSLDFHLDRFQFADFYIEHNEYSDNAKNKYHLLEVGCDNHVGWFADPVSAYIAGEKKFTVVPLSTQDQYIKALEERVSHVAESESYDMMSDDEYNELVRQCKRTLKSKPVAAKTRKKAEE